MTSRVIVVGGGLAGLAAASALVERGLDVRLIERRPFVGGKAFSFADPLAGHDVDNGQHAFLSAYRNVLGLLDRWGTLPLVRFNKRLDLVFMSPGQGAMRFRSARLPAPLHLLGALAGLRSLPASDILGMALPALRLLSLDGAGRQNWDEHSFESWLKSCKQGNRAIRAFWEPLALAAVNGPPGEISAYMALQVLALGFLGSERTCKLGYATVGLSRLLEPALDYIGTRGGGVMLGHEIASVRPADGAGHRQDDSGRPRWEVRFRDGRALEAEHVVLAVPPWRLAKLLSSHVRTESGLAAACTLPTAPIVSVQLRYDRPVMSHDAVAFLESPFHWAFALDRLRSDAPAGTVSLTTSCGRKLASLPQAEIRELALTEIARFFPAAANAELRSCKVIKEMDATLACAPGQDALRPEVATGLKGLYVAGAWTRTGLPGTLEGAAMSGLSAAEAIERARGRPWSCVQPLPEPGGLAAVLRRWNRITRKKR